MYSGKLNEEQNLNLPVKHNESWENLNKVLRTNKLQRDSEKKN